jgi:predicted metalloendopeptidase
MIEAVGDRSLDRQRGLFTPAQRHHGPVANLLPPLFDTASARGELRRHRRGHLRHELTHGFDDTGDHSMPTQPDDWWSDAATAAFEERAQCVETQFSGYMVAGQPVNGGSRSERTLPISVVCRSVMKR